MRREGAVERFGPLVLIVIAVIWFSLPDPQYAKMTYKYPRTTCRMVMPGGQESTTTCGPFPVNYDNHCASDLDLGRSLDRECIEWLRKIVHFYGYLEMVAEIR